MCEKKPYPTIEDARAALRGIRARARADKLPQAVYPCRECSGTWHLTSKQLGGAWRRKYGTRLI